MRRIAPRFGRARIDAGPPISIFAMKKYFRNLIIYTAFLLIFTDPTFAQNVFVQPEAIPTGVDPLGVASADMNNDGKADLVVTSPNPAKVFVHFAPGFSFVGISVVYPERMVLGDLNNDGNIDIVVQNEPVNASAYVILNNGNTTFAPPSAPIALNAIVRAFTLADITGDGKLDMVNATFMNGTIMVMRGQGTGGFGVKINYPALVNPTSVTTGDFNGDGRLDVAAGSLNLSNLAILLNTGGGALAAPMVTNYPNPISGIAAADLNNDSKVDIAASFGDTTYGKIGALLGSGSGSFAVQPFVFVSGQPQRLAIGDVNGDSIPDAATIQFDSPNISVVLSDGTGGFTPTRIFIVGKVIPGLVIGRFDNDTNGDICVPVHDQDTINIIHGDGAGGFTAPESYKQLAGPYGVATGDFNNDSLPDIASVMAGSVSGISGKIAISTGQPGGGFVVTSYLTGTNLQFDNLWPVVADINNDGFDDVLALNTQLDYGTVYYGSAGGFTTSATFGTVGSPIAAAAVDLNMDGRLDIATANALTNKVSVLLQNPGSGGGHAPAVYYSTASNPRGLVSFDFNGDGIPDVATANLSAGNVGVLLGSGTGTLGASTNFSVGMSPVSIVKCDLNNDSLVDLVMAGSSSTKLGVLLASGPGAFATAMNYSVATGATYASANDWNGDGFDDVFVSSGIFGNAQLLLGGPLGLGAPIFLRAGAFPTNSAACDVDGDGRPDLLAADTGYYLSHGIVVLKGAAGPAPFTNDYGAGTAGCAGTQGIAANAIPKVNSPNFGFISTNCPPAALGFLLVSDAQDPAGSDPFGIFVKLHVGLLTATEIYTFDVVSGHAGTAFVNTPIPNDNNFIGKIYDAQTLWLWDSTAPCDPSPYLLSSSRGLQLTVQP